MAPAGRVLRWLTGSSASRTSREKLQKKPDVRQLHSAQLSATSSPYGALMFPSTPEFRMQSENPFHKRQGRPPRSGELASSARAWARVSA